MNGWNSIWNNLKPSIVRCVAIVGLKIDSKDLRNGRDTFDISLFASLSLSLVWHINLWSFERVPNHARKLLPSCGLMIIFMRNALQTVLLQIRTHSAKAAAFTALPFNVLTAQPHSTSWMNEWSKKKGEKLKFNSLTVECLPDVVIVSHNYGHNLHVRLCVTNVLPQKERERARDRCHILD